MNRIRELRKQKGITASELAERLNITPKHLYDLEIGKRRLHEDALIQLAQIFDVSVDYLLGNDPPNGQNQPDPSTEPATAKIIGDSDPEFIDLLYRVKDLTEDEKQSLLEHWEWAMKVIEEERERRRKFREKFGNGGPD